MVDSGSKADFGRLERIIGRELDVEEKDATGIRGVGRAHNSRLPVELINHERQYFCSRARCHGPTQSTGHDAMPGVEPCLSKSGVAYPYKIFTLRASRAGGGRIAAEEQHVSIRSKSINGMHLWRLQGRPRRRDILRRQRRRRHKPRQPRPHH